MARGWTGSAAGSQSTAAPHRLALPRCRWVQWAEQQPALQRRGAGRAAGELPRGWGGGTCVGVECPLPTLVREHAGERTTVPALPAVGPRLQNLLARADPLCNVLSGQLEAAQRFFGAGGS